MSKYICVINSYFTCFFKQNVVSEYEAPFNKNSKESNGMSLHSKDSTGKSHSRFASNDYEAIINHAEYQTAVNFYSSNTRSSTFFNDSIISEYSEITGVTNNEEEIYSNPGYSKEDVYTCFEKKKFCMVKRSDIR